MRPLYDLFLSYIVCNKLGMKIMNCLRNIHAPSCQSSCWSCVVLANIVLYTLIPPITEVVVWLGTTQLRNFHTNDNLWQLTAHPWEWTIYHHNHMSRHWYSVHHLNAKANLRDLIAATSLVALKLDSNSWFFSPCDLEIWWMTSNIIGHLFYITSSFVHHLKPLGEFKLELLSEDAQFGSKLAIFCRVWPWNLMDDVDKQ